MGDTCDVLGGRGCFCPPLRWRLWLASAANQEPATIPPVEPLPPAPEKKSTRKRKGTGAQASAAMVNNVSKLSMPRVVLHPPMPQGTASSTVVRCYVPFSYREASCGRFAPFTGRRNGAGPDDVSPRTRKSRVTSISNPPETTCGRCTPQGEATATDCGRWPSLADGLLIWRANRPTQILWHPRRTCGEQYAF